MSTKSDYLSVVLDKIGAPLMAGILRAQANDTDGKADTLENEAQTMAALLSKVVQGAIELGGLADIAAAGDRTDALRLAMAGVAAPLLAEQFETGGKLPTDQDIKKISAAMQAVVTFAENFTPDGVHQQALENAAPTGTPADPHQTHVQYFQSFAPVVGAVAEFPFGQAEPKLMMEIASKLLERARSTTAELAPDSDELARKPLELAVLSSLSQIYAALHRAETRHIMAMSEEERSNTTLSMQPIWDKFDSRMTMVEALAQTIIGGSPNVVPASGSPPAASSSREPASEKPPVTASKPQEQDGNPMAMFAAKPSGDDAPAKAESSKPETPAPPASEEKKESSPEEPESSPPEKPKEEPKEKSRENPQENSQENPQENPMSFFSGPSKTDEEE